MKRCGRCFEAKASDEFAFRNTSDGRRHSICKTCQRVYRADYVERVGRRAHHARIAGWMTKYRSERRRQVDAYLVKHPCVDCGETDPAVLDFDHVRGTKRASIAEMIRDRRAMGDIWAEIEKCDVRCANCHRKKTARTLWNRPPQEGIARTERILRCATR